MKIGINLPEKLTDSYDIKLWLKRFCDAGYEVVEYCSDMLPMIIGGKLNREITLFMKKLTDEFPLTYSMHIGYGIDLRDTENYELQENSLMSSIEAAAETGCILLNLHYEKKSDSREVEERFLEGHLKACDYAEKLGIDLAIENIELEYVNPVIDFVKEVNRKNFKMNYDIGHGFLASDYLKFDFFESIKKSIPVLGHLHFSDNTGKFEKLRISNRPVYDNLPMGNRFALGRGDIHLPPLWGNIPYNKIAEILKDYDKIIICEFYTEYFIPFLKDIRINTENLFK